MGKATIFELLFQAQQVLEHDCKIDGLTMDEAESAFAEVREALNKAVEVVDYYLD